jgi:hypothetical protein
VAVHRRPQADRSPLRWTYRHVGPRHDRLDLADDELRALAALERSLPAPRAARWRLARRRSPGRWARAWLTLAPLVRLAPWLLPIGVAVMVAFVATSVAVSFLGALLAATGLAAVIDRVARRVRRRVGRRSNPPSPPQG